MKCLWPNLGDFAELSRVCEQKPLGYTCRSAADMGGRNFWSPLSLRFFCDARGLKTQMERQPSGAITLYAYHPEALQAFLNERANLLDAHGWPTNVYDFIGRVAPENVCPKTALFDLIADAFADYSNPWRTDVETPASHMAELRRLLRENPQQFQFPALELIE